jgi:hypothetical protein
MTPQKTEEALDAAIEYLEENGFDVPEFDVEFTEQVGGSMVFEDGSMRLGVYPGQRRRDWFVMHEMIHMLVLHHGVRLPAPFNRRAWPGGDNWAVRACMDAGRADGYPSIYAETGGGEEFLCELFALMYVEGGFDEEPPVDLAKAWDVAWNRVSTQME